MGSRSIVTLYIADFVSFDSIQIFNMFRLCSIAIIILLFVPDRAFSQYFWSLYYTPAYTQKSCVLVDSVGSIYFSARNNQQYGTWGVYRSDDDGFSWNVKNNGLSYQSSMLSLDQNKLGTIFAGANSKIYKSNDRGETWSCAFTNEIYAANYDVIKCGMDSVIVAGGQDFHGIVRSGDFGETWSIVLDVYTPGQNEAITDIEFGPNGVIYACSRIMLSNENARIFASYDQGRSWEVFSSINSTYLTAIGFDNQGRMLRGTFGVGVHRYDFNTSQWEHIFSTFGTSPSDFLSLPDNQIFLACSYWPNHSYAGVMHSSDGGDTYQWLNSGLSLTYRDALFFEPDTIGRIWVLSANELYRSIDTIITKVQSDAAKCSSLTIHPNPCNGLLTIEPGNSSGGEFWLYDARGVCIRRIRVESEIVEVDLTGHAPGLYLVKDDRHQAVRLLLR